VIFGLTCIGLFCTYLSVHLLAASALICLCVGLEEVGYGMCSVDGW